MVSSRCQGRCLEALSKLTRAVGRIGRRTTEPRSVSSRLSVRSAENRLESTLPCRQAAKEQESTGGREATGIETGSVLRAPALLAQLLLAVQLSAAQRPGWRATILCVSPTPNRPRHTRSVHVLHIARTVLAWLGERGGSTSIGRMASSSQNNSGCPMPLEILSASARYNLRLRCGDGQGGRLSKRLPRLQNTRGSVTETSTTNVSISIYGPRGSDL